MKIQTVVIAKVVGKPNMHYALAIRESYTYKLLCDGAVVDALGCAGEGTHPTCSNCLALDKPKDAGQAAKEVGQMLGYESRAGGWVYKNDQAVCQGWNAFARAHLANFAAEGYVVPVAGLQGRKRFQVVVGAL